MSKYHSGQQFHDDMVWIILGILLVIGFVVMLAVSLLPLFLFLLACSIVLFLAGAYFQSEDLMKYAGLAALVLGVGVLVSFGIGHIFGATPVGQAGVQVYNSLAQTAQTVRP